MASEQEAALINSAVDLGPLGADDDFGYGRLDLLAAYDWLNSVPPPDPNLNVALGKTAIVSSSQDSSHGGEMAVDGDPGTFWQTRRAKGKDKLPTEWIMVDLGSSMSVGRIVLEWDGNFATSYDIRLSDDGNTWATVVSTSNGDGGNDTVSFSSTQARYVQMESTAWSSGSQRNWLREFEVYAGDGSVPTATPTPQPTEPPPEPPGSAPQAPSDLTVGKTDRKSIALSWIDNADSEDGFHVERSTDGGASWTQVATTTKPGVTEYTDRGLSRKTTYWYRVQAYNAVGVSGYSNTVLAATK